MTDDEDTRPYCIEGCGQLAIGERTVGVYMDDEAEDGFWESVELVCGDHAG